MFSAPTLAGYCAKIEYAEAKDWSVDDLERGYCQAMDGLYDSVRIASLEAKGGNVTRANATMREGDVCMDQAGMFERILKNAHKRDKPACPKK